MLNFEFGIVDFEFKYCTSDLGLLGKPNWNKSEIRNSKSEMYCC